MEFTVEFTVARGGMIDTACMTIWVRTCVSFAEEREVDREFWATMTPDSRLAAVEQLRREWALISGRPEERPRRIVRVLDGPER